MKWFSFTAALAITSVVFGGVFAETPSDKGEPNVIPLDKIWALRMPGTRDVRKLSTAQEPNVFEILRSIGPPPRDKEPDPGFAVSGTGLDALREAYATLVKAKTPRETFPNGVEVSIVFFAHEIRPYIHLRRVERQGHDINVYHQFVFHEEEVTSGNIALIRLGKLKPGKYRVNIKRINPVNLRRFSNFDASQAVCKSFSFTVSE